MASASIALGNGSAQRKDALTRGAASAPAAGNCVKPASSEAHLSEDRDYVLPGQTQASGNIRQKHSDDSCDAEEGPR